MSPHLNHRKRDKIEVMQTKPSQTTPITLGFLLCLSFVCIVSGTAYYALNMYERICTNGNYLDLFQCSCRYDRTRHLFCGCYEGQPRLGIGGHGFCWFFGFRTDRRFASCCRPVAGSGQPVTEVRWHHAPQYSVCGSVFALYYGMIPSCPFTFFCAVVFGEG